MFEKKGENKRRNREETVIKKQERVGNEREREGRK